MPYNNFKLNIRGFSLVELLLSLSLIALVVTIALPNLRSFSRTQEIDGTAASLADVLEKGQSGASSHIKCPDGMASTNWNVVLSNSTYILNCATTANQQVSTGTYKANSNTSTTFTLTPDKCTPLTFIFAGQQLTYQCGGVNQSSWPVRLTLSNGANLTKVVVVEAGGIIRIE